MEDVNVDLLQSRLGNGRFQLLVFLLLGLFYSRGAWHVFGIMFLAGDPGHKCALPGQTSGEGGSDSLLLSSPFLDLLPLRSNSSGKGSVNLTDTAFMATDSPPGSLLPTTVDLNSNMLHAAYSGDGESVGMARSNWTAETCAVSYLTNNGSSVVVQGECPYGWSYGSQYETTVLSEWDLVCDNDFLVELSITIFMVGSLVGAMTILPLADQWGRRRVLLACLLGQALVGTAAAFVNHYVLFTLLRFLVGMLNIGIGICSYVLMTETFAAKRRTVMSIAFQAFWALGVMTVALFGYLVRHWRHLELLLSLPNLLALPCFWLLPESLPWLISQKRWTQAKATAQKIARMNGIDVAQVTELFPEDCDDSSPQNVAMQGRMLGKENTEPSSGIDKELEINSLGQTELLNGPETAAENAVTCSLLRVDSGTEGNGRVNGCSVGGNGEMNGCRLKGARNGCSVGENGEMNGGHSKGGRNGCAEGGPAVQQCSNSILDLFRHRRMRLYSCVMFFLFFVNSLGYFGISFSVPVMHGNPFVNLALMGLVEIPANLVCILVSHRIGRRYPNAVFLLLCGVSNIGALFTPDSLGTLKLVFVMLGKFAITAAYSTIYLYSAEIFPTAIRNQAVGMSSVFENIGSISAPFIVHAAKSVAELPLVVFGVLSIAGAGLTLLLPETHNRPLPQTVQEITTW